MEWSLEQIGSDNIQVIMDGWTPVLGCESPSLQRWGAEYIRCHVGESVTFQWQQEAILGAGGTADCSEYLDSNNLRPRYVSNVLMCPETFSPAPISSQTKQNFISCLEISLCHRQIKRLSLLNYQQPNTNPPLSWKLSAWRHPVLARRPRLDVNIELQIAKWEIKMS